MMTRLVTRLSDRMLDALLPKATAAAADCICCPGGHHSVTCVGGNLYVLSCCCEWEWVCGNGCCL